MDFIHLRNHTSYSFLRGVMSPELLLERVKELGMPGAAITDRNSMFGIVPFYRKALELGIKPILGAVLTDSFNESLTLLALDRRGYSHISSVITRLNLSHNEEDIHGADLVNSSPMAGVAVLTGGKEGMLWRLLEEGNLPEAESLLQNLKDRIENLYLEVNISNYNSDRKVLTEFRRLSRRFNIPAVLTSVNNLSTADGYSSAELLSSIREHRSYGINEGEQNENQHILSPEEMSVLAGDWSELLENSVKLSEMANVDLELGKFHIPVYPEAKGNDNEYLRMVCYGNLGRYYHGESRRPAIKRLEFELKIIQEKGLSGFFLIVSDLVKYARANNIPVGPGRGSAGSAIVSYLSGITTIDPIKYNLYFERFLNPERTQLPDIDIDFGHRERDRIFEYARKKYGDDRVAHISTICHFGWRGAVRESAKALGFDEKTISTLTRFFPTYFQTGLEEILKSNPDLEKMINSNDKFMKVLELASSIFGLPRNPSLHASGFIISDQPLYHYAPLQYSDNGEIIVQITKDEFEDFGLLKIDCLGLRFLSVVYDTVKKLYPSIKYPYRFLEQIPLEDEPSLKMLANGDGIGVFQLESGGIRDLLQGVKIRKFKDIFEVLALYRPGPLEGGMIPKYLVNRNAEKYKSVFEDDIIKEILKDTYGIIIFQEQVMQIAEKVAGFTLGQAEILRKAMGKRIPELMKNERERFVSGAVERGYAKEKANRIFDTLVNFSGYGFNKAHSVGYGYIAYWCAYFKQHHPAEYYTALLNAFIDFGAFIQTYIFYIERKGIEFLMPEINSSEFGFSAEGRNIRIGFISLKGIGYAGVQEILRKRVEAGGRFLSLEHFLSLVSRRIISKRVIEILISSGVFRNLGEKQELLQRIEQIRLDKNPPSKEEYSAQLEFFSYKNNKDVKNRDRANALNDAKDFLEFIVSPDENISRKIGTGKDITVRGFVTRYRSIRTKTGKKMAFFTLENNQFSYECILFPDSYLRHRRRLFSSDGTIEVHGELNTEEGLPKIIVK